MVTANIDKKTYKYHQMDSLSVNEQKALGKAIIGFGNLKKAVEHTGLSESTIKRAKAGMRVNPDTRSKLIAYLNSEKK